MSGIAVALDRPGGRRQPAPPEEAVRTLLAALAHRGGVRLPSDGRPSVILREARGIGRGVEWANTDCALGAQLLPRTPEDANDEQPLVDPASGCVLVWDGRLDNREELAATLGLTAGSLPDSRLVLPAFLRWREHCPSRLLGDFAFAVWDSRARSLFAARDPMGVRPLFYHAGNDRLLLASEVQALYQLPGVPREPDEVMACEALLGWSGYPQIERTFYHGIFRLPPAHWLLCDSGGLRFQRYWDIDPSHQLRYRRREDYLEQYHDLLQKAVGCRLRAARPVGIFLSGGMDSSAVASVAGRLALKERPLAFHFQLGDEQNESRIAKQVAAQAGLPFHSLPLREENVLDELPALLRLTGIPETDLMFPNDLRLAHLAAQQGCGSIFTGDGSDEAFAFGWAYVADMICSLRWLRLAKTIAPYARYHGRSAWSLLQKSFRYLPPRPLLGLWKRAKWRKAPPWIAPDLSRRAGLVERLRSLPAKLAFPSFSTREDFAILMRGHRILIDERRDHEAAILGLEYRFPFYDCRLLEFMFAVPWEKKVDGWKVKPFLRELPGLLPEALQQLKKKANYVPHSERLAFAQDWQSMRPLFASPPQGAEQFVELRFARHIAEQFLERGDRSQQEAFFHIATVLLWIQDFHKKDNSRPGLP